LAAVLDARAAKDGRSWTAGARVLAAAICVLSVAMAVDLARRADVPVEVVTPLTLALAFAACVVVFAGAAAAVATRNGDVAVLAFSASMLLLVAVALTIFGVFVLPFVTAIVVVLARRTAGRRRVALAALSGPVMAAGVAVLLVIWVQPPVVECHEDGVEATSRPWWGSESGSGSSSSAVLGEIISRGSIQTPAGVFEYECRGPVLMEFSRV
jgi:hypothetical protein